MKHSIAKIFKNLNLFLLLSLTLASISLLFIVEQSYSYNTISILKNQKTMMSNILLQKEKEQINILEFNEKIANFQNEIKKLQKQSQYNYISIYILQNSVSYNDELKQLYLLVSNFNKKSRDYLNIKTNDSNFANVSNALSLQSKNIRSAIDSMIFQNIQYNQEKFNISSKVFIVLFILLFITTMWYKRRLVLIYKDILFIRSTGTDAKANLFTQEIDAIFLRMNKRAQTSSNPAMIDPITEINNHKGMLHEYSQRKTTQDNTFSSVIILEVDNFSKAKRAFSQEFTHSILKKVAYTISLHQQATDIISRSDYNQFTLIFSRASKEQLFKHADLIRQSIAELKLKNTDSTIVNITVTGSFINKTSNAPIEESIRQAKNLLQQAKQIGKDRIVQMKDIPKSR